MVLTRSSMDQSPEEPAGEQEETSFEDLSDLAFVEALRGKHPKDLTLEQRVEVLEHIVALLSRDMMDRILREKISNLSNFQMIGPEDEVDTANGPIKMKDIPVDSEGRPTEEWALENCLCERHVAAREAHEGGTGQYV
jgi:hypothetical protein